MADAKLTRGSIAGHLVKQTLPMVLGITCIIGVGLVDAYFIGSLGAEPLAAVAFIFPVTMALSSLGVGVMVGVNSVISRLLGAGEDTTAECRAAQGVVFAGVAGILIALALWLGQDALFALMGASDELLALVKAYVVPYCLGFPFLLVAMGENGVLRGQGEAIMSSSMLVCIALVNAALDPLLIFGIGPFPELGVMGAGVALAIAHVAGAGIGLWLMNRSELRFDPRRCLSSGVGRGLRDIARVGAPAALANAINPAGLAVLTALLARHGEGVVAAFGAAGRVQAFVAVPLLAMSSSIGPIVGQNWGAGEAARARATLRLAAIVCVVYGLAAAVPLVLWREAVASLFAEEQAVVQAMGRYLSIGAWGFFAYGLLIVSNGAMNAVDRSGRALAVSAARVLAVMVPLAWLGTRTIGPTGVFAAELAANVLGGAAALWIAWRALCPERRKAPAPVAQPAE